MKNYRKPMEEPLAPDSYGQFLADLKGRIRAAQLRASLAVNRELVLLYWQIGRDIHDRQERENWGAKVIERLAADLKRAFPDMKGFSPRNLKYMRAFGEAWPDEAIVQQLVAQIPWGHNVRILDRVKASEDRIWYAKATIQHGWSRDVLVHQIESGRLNRQGKSRRQLRPHLARAAIRPRAGHHQRSLQLRFSHPRRRCARARPAGPPAPVSSGTRRRIRLCGEPIPP